MFDNDDEILGLVRKEGLLKPSADFTSRVMQRIGEAREPVFYKPLLSKRAWGLLIVATFAVIVICWQVFAGSTETSQNSLGLLDRIAGYFSNIDLSFQFNANALLIITLAILSMGILLLIDFLFSNNDRENAF